MLNGDPGDIHNFSTHGAGMFGKWEVIMTIYGGAQPEIKDKRCERVLVAEYRRTQLRSVIDLESQIRWRLCSNSSVEILNSKEQSSNMGLKLKR